MEHTDQSEWIINLNYLSNPLPTLQSTQPRSARAINPDDCQPAGLCDSQLLRGTPGGETGLFRRIVKRMPGGGSDPFWHPCVFCLFSCSPFFPCTQMVHFEEAGCRFHPCMRFPHSARRHVLSRSTLYFISLLRFSNATWNDVSRRNLHFPRSLLYSVKMHWMLVLHHTGFFQT